MSRRRTFDSTSAHYSITGALTMSGVGARRITKPMAEFSREMRIIAKAAGIGDLAESLACAQQLPAMQKARGVIQTNRMYEMTAGGVVRRKEFLKIA